MLEDAHLINYLDMAIISDTVNYLRARIDAGESVVPVSVNLSRYDLADAGIVDEITDMMDIAHLDHRLIKIEITESAVASNEDRINQIVHAFQERGFEVWMDDFGSGYSSLNMLQETSFDLIKLDMRFMRTNNPDRGMILVREILHMAQAMGLNTLVEGVEERKQVDALKEMGCGKIQGFYYSKPLSKENLDGYMHTHKVKDQEDFC